MKALFCAANSWFNHARVGSHHLALGLARKGWDIAFVSDPISPLHVLNGISPELKQRFHLWKDQGIQVEPRIWAWVPAALATPHSKPILRSQWIAQYWQWLTLPNICSVVRYAGFDKVDLLYVDSLIQYCWWKNNISAKKVIFRLADNPMGFKKFTISSNRALKEICSYADHIVYTSPKLKNIADLLAQGKNSLLMNGVAFSHFRKKTLPPPEYEDIRKKVIYVGSIEDWFDFDTANFLISSLPDIAFIFIGPDHIARKKILDKENVLILGPRSFDVLPSYMQHASVGIIPFATRKYPDLINSINPLKLYEYLASGLPVVSSYWDTLASLKAPISLVKTKEDFLKSLVSVLSSPTDTAILQNFSRQFDWSSKVDQLLDIID